MAESSGIDLASLSYYALIWGVWGRVLFKRKMWNWKMLVRKYTAVSFYGHFGNWSFGVMAWFLFFFTINGLFLNSMHFADLRLVFILTHIFYAKCVHYSELFGKIIANNKVCFYRLQHSPARKWNKIYHCVFVLFC